VDTLHLWDERGGFVKSGVLYSDCDESEYDFGFASDFEHTEGRDEISED
jgi:hypothetical protein